ncbi:response regulator transcription factor [Serratia fonticola]|uniref:response regulator transcription factor n=1 Tax=Serratia fonticola TaxID=47917 RepID=UPI001C464072|nr:LuxR C-terminal-related transcriptional regulator [Serratia fonticola]QXN63849.1 response regulator transcription factor [Serratia fonticola]
MNSRIVIALWGKNFYFLHGIRHLFERYFYLRGVSPLFVHADCNDIIHLKVADLIVRSNASWRGDGYQRYQILIRKNIEGVTYQQGEIGLNDKPEAVMQLLDRLFDVQLNNNATCVPDYEKITRRELEVLQAIAAGLSPTQIARKLQISTKTVSAHKQASMRKLGFQRSHDLYHWLWQGNPNISRNTVGEG